MMRVSCITTTYKRNTLILYRAIDSVLRQDYPDIELIVCDDCSGDFPVSAVTDYIENHKRNNIKRYLVYSNEENLGTVKNFNKAITLASGDYFINVSDDDAFYNAHVMTGIVQMFQDTGADICTCRAVLASDDPGLNGRYFHTRRQIRHLRDDAPSRLFNRIAVDNFIPGPCTFFTRSWLKRYGAFNERYLYIEDWPRFLRLFRDGEKIAFFDIVSTRYSTGGISNSNEQPMPYLLDALAICENEILAFPNLITRCTARYNHCRRESLLMRIEKRNLWANKLLLAMKYPDVMLHHLYFRLHRRFGRPRKDSV